MLKGEICPSRIVEFELCFNYAQFYRDTFGERSLIGDKRWAGAHGLDADFVAYEDCSVVYILTQDVLVRIFPTIKKEFQHQTDFESIYVFTFD